jgi:hypothetical protein
MRTLAGAVLVAALLVGGCTDSKKPTAASSAFDPFATAASSTAPRPSTPPAALNVGDCFDTGNFTPGASIARGDIFPVPCPEPHQHEVYAIANHPDGANAPYPGDAAMTAFADDRCLAAFAPALGVDYRQSTQDFATIVPDAPAWQRGERAVICAAHDANFNELTGSLTAKRG